MNANLAELISIEYEHGASPDMLAIEYGVSVAAVRNTLTTTNATRRDDTPQPVPVVEPMDEEEPRRGGRRKWNLSPYRVQTLVAEYEAGTSLNRLEALYGKRRLTIRRLLVANGVTIRGQVESSILRCSGQKGHRKGGSKRIRPSPTQLAQMVSDYVDAGMSVHDIGSKHGMSGTTVAKILKENGVTMRPTNNPNGAKGRR